MSLSETDSNVRNKNEENPQLNLCKNFSSKTRDTVKFFKHKTSSETKFQLPQKFLAPPSIIITDYPTCANKSHEYRRG